MQTNDLRRKLELGLLVMVFSAMGTAVAAQDAKFPNVPGVVVDHWPQSTGKYVGSPSIAILPGGDLVASHDLFGPNAKEKTRTMVFRSRDHGATWSLVGEIPRLYWGTLFVHREMLYVLGVAGHDVVICRSEDGGATWTQPDDETTGRLLADGRHYHCGTVPVLIHDGRIWRAIEYREGPWGTGFHAGMMSAPVDADLLDANAWTVSNFLPCNTNWLEGRFTGWLEGNAVAAPDGQVVNVLRVD